MDWFERAVHALKNGSAILNSTLRAGRSAAPRRRLTYEPLEPRLTMAAAGLVPVGTQPTGPLTGKIVYTSGGHGWDYSTTLGRWATDRGDNNEIIEDFGNQEQMTYFADYLLRAGATVVPMRPVGRQINEVVLDNDSVGVTFTGAWADSAGARHYDEDYGAVADPVKYRFSSVNNATETATATYTPNIPAAGFYPVYTWVTPSTNRALQLYEINHTGGQTQIRVDHRAVGNGWVYLGTYHFNNGSSEAEGSVQISNLSSAGTVVIADAIRFGNGMGDVPDGPSGIGTGSVSGYPREDENSEHWLWRGIGLGVTPSSVISGNVSAPSNMAQHMNQLDPVINPFGNSVYIGFHSNAGGGVGARGLIDTDVADRTPHQADLALFTGRQINQDMQALDADPAYANLFGAGWSWYTGSTHTFTGQFGEIDLGAGAEMDATIIEVAFHDSAADAGIMREPLGRDQIGRSTYQAVLEYFDVWGGLTSPVSVATAPTNVRAVSNASGEVTLNWSAGPSTPAGAYGAAPTDYRIYSSSDGYGFDGGTLVAGGGTTSATLTGFDPALPYYFKVVAVNAGGESLASEVVTALPTGGARQILIVNGFERFERSQNFRYPYAFTGDGLVDRVWSRYNNSFDYVVQVHTAIHEAKPGIHVASANNDAVISGAVNLSDYHTVIWISGEESTTHETFNSTEQMKIEQFIAAGGNLFVSGSEIAWDLDRPSGPTAADRTFFETTLQGNYVSDDAGTYTATPAATGIFAGMSSNFVFSNGAAFSMLDGQLYNVDFPDVIAPQSDAIVSLNYNNGSGAAAIQVQGTGGRGSIVMFGFPFETITDADRRAVAIDRIFDFFGLNELPPNADFNKDGTVDGADYVVWRKTNGTSVPLGSAGDADWNGVVNEDDFVIWKSQYGTMPPVLGGGAFMGSGGSAVQPTELEVSQSAPLAAATVDVSPSALSDPAPLSNIASAFGGVKAGSRSSAAVARRVVRTATDVGHDRNWSALLSSVAQRRQDRDELDQSPSAAATASDAAYHEFNMEEYTALHIRWRTLKELRNGGSFAR